MNKGLALVELLMAIAIAAIVAGVTVAMLRAGFDVYTYSHKEIILDKTLDDCLDEITDGGFTSHGIQDALEIFAAGPRSITFVPLWTDDTHIASFEHSQPALVRNSAIVLNRPIKPGAAFPIAEVGEEASTPSHPVRWKPIPIEFLPGSHLDPKTADDKVFLIKPVPAGSRLRFIFHPDAAHYRDCAVTIRWQDGRIERSYKNKREIIPVHGVEGVTVSDFKLQYFDNTNTEIKAGPERITNITAVRPALTVSFTEPALSRRRKTVGFEERVSKAGFSFINIRNTKTGGAGLLLQEGTRVRIPDSSHIRVFTLSNVSGLRGDEGAIELEARPQKGLIWKAVVQAGFIDDKPVVKGYTIEYPPGNPVYSREIVLHYGEPLNFMNIGDEGRYDYDYDKAKTNVVNLEGDVELVVTRMDAKGAMLFIRP